MEILSKQKKTKALFSFLFLALLGIVSRLIPHLPNCTPIATMLAFSAYWFERRLGLLLCLVILIASDIVIASLSGYPIVGDWTLFTYSGFALLSYLSARHAKKRTRVNLYLIIVLSTIYWLWTNFGTWLLSGLYPHSVTGFTLCYLAALPFLRNALIANSLTYFLASTYLLDQHPTSNVNWKT